MADLTRLEQFLNHIAHPEDPIPTPLTRMEQSLLEIAENKDEAALPDYSEASDGDVLAIDNGVPAWTSGGGAGGNAEWNDELKNIVIIELEAVSDFAADMICFCSDGVVFSSLTLSRDAESGDVTLIVGEWHNDIDNPVPADSFTTICARLELAVTCHFYPLLGWFSDKSMPAEYLEPRIIVCR